MKIKRGYIGTGEFEALGYDWRGFITTPPSYSAAYNRIYR